jgi:putative flippase GtrA
MSVLGYVFGFIASQEFVFKDELSMRPSTAGWLRFFTIATGFLVSALGIIRLLSSNGSVCEPWPSVILSALFGIILAIVFVTTVTTIGGRTKINVLQLPLLEKRIPDEKPIYVCENPNN